jgi:hypothetical protein
MPRQEVIVVDEQGVVRARGTTDGKVVDSFYVHVAVNGNGPGTTIYNMTSVYAFASEGLVKSELARMKREEKELRDRHQREHMALFQEHGVRRES